MNKQSIEKVIVQPSTVQEGDPKRLMINRRLAKRSQSRFEEWVADHAVFPNAVSQELAQSLKGTYLYNHLENFKFRDE